MAFNKNHFVSRCSFIVDAVYEAMVSAKANTENSTQWQLVRAAIVNNDAPNNLTFVIIVANSDHPRHLAIITRSWDEAIINGLLTYNRNDLVELPARLDFVDNPDTEFIEATLIITFTKPPCFWSDAKTGNRTRQLKHPVNDKCICGSGIKFKKCCMTNNILNTVAKQAKCTVPSSVKYNTFCS